MFSALDRGRKFLNSRNILSKNSFIGIWGKPTVKRKPATLRDVCILFCSAFFFLFCLSKMMDAMNTDIPLGVEMAGFSSPHA